MENEPKENEITFTQYLMPEGRPSPVFIERTPDVVAKAKALIAKGYKFECEMLSDYKTISLTVVDPDDENDVAIEVCNNGPSVPPAVDRLVEMACVYDKKAA